MSMKLTNREFLIDRVIREKDSIILAGEEKAGKSLCIKQMICSLTTQHPLFDKFDVARVCRVGYTQLEGELEDTQDRLYRMTRVLDFEPDNFQILYSAPLELQDREVTKKFIELWKDFKPDVLILDPIYFSFSGDLSNNDVVRQFTGNCRRIKEALDCAMILVHHVHKTKFDHKGKAIFEGDGALFGSRFFNAWADHILFFAYDKKNNLRILKCDTQRSGTIENESKLKLNEPLPLYFSEIEDNPSREALILELLSKNPEGLTVAQLEVLTKTSVKTIYKAFKGLLAKHLIEKTDGRPVMYSIQKAC